MLIQGTCTYCSKETEVAPLKDWNNEERVNYYCRDHWYEARRFEEKDKADFIKYYSDPIKFKWLSEEKQELFNRFTKK